MKKHKLSISPGNSKLTVIPNISLPPIKTCVQGARCADEGCYALHSYKQYPNVRAAWDGNLAYFKADPEAFFEEIHDWLQMHNPPYFRIHVGGDFVNEYYLHSWFLLAHIFTNIKFLAFTKKAEMITSYMHSNWNLPLNLKIVFSVWPSMCVPANPYEFPTAWLQEDIRRDKTGMYIGCHGTCGACGYACWERIDSDLPVVFPRH